MVAAQSSKKKQTLCKSLKDADVVTDVYSCMIMEKAYKLPKSLLQIKRETNIPTGTAYRRVQKLTKNWLLKIQPR